MKYYIFIKLIVYFIYKFTLNLKKIGLYAANFFRSKNMERVYVKSTFFFDKKWKIAAKNQFVTNVTICNYFVTEKRKKKIF